MWAALELVWQWLQRVKSLYDLLPQRFRDWCWWVAGWLVTEVWALWATVSTLPPHGVVLVSIGSLAGVTVFMQGVASLHSRLSLLRLIRDAEHFIEIGRPIRDAAQATRGNLPVLAGKLREVEDWRTAMHARMLVDPRVRQFEGMLREKDPAHDRITIPLQGLEQALANLRTYL